MTACQPYLQPSSLCVEDLSSSKSLHPYRNKTTQFLGHPQDLIKWSLNQLHPISLNLLFFVLPINNPLKNQGTWQIYDPPDPGEKNISQVILYIELRQRTKSGTPKERDEENPGTVDIVAMVSGNVANRQTNVQTKLIHVKTKDFPS